MKIHYCFLFVIMTFAVPRVDAQLMVGDTEIDTTTILSGLDTPWEIRWGPDDNIWFTERYGRVSRFNPTSRELTVLLNIPEVHEQSESGLLGMTFHPDFPTTPYVYLVYNYFEDSRIKERLVRYRYNGSELVSEEILLNDIGGSGNHNGSRLEFGPDGKLYMTTGDAVNTSLSQDTGSLNGKILRINADGTKPSDNPFNNSYVYSLGHRNPQGLVFAPSGILYSSEHGPATDDELNIIEGGRNYGWPEVRGFCEETSEIEFCNNKNVKDPLIAWTPTLAVAGIDYYDHPAIPGWQNSILMTTLKESELVVMNLSEDGSSVLNNSYSSVADNWWGRLRDVCVSPDGRVFISTSNRDGRGNVKPGDDRIVELKAISDPTGINNNEKTFRIYPNPVSGDRIFIEGGRLSPDAEIRIYSISGRLLSTYYHEKSVQALQLDFPGKPGVYILEIRDGEIQQHQKVIRK